MASAKLILLVLALFACALATIPDEHQETSKTNVKVQVPDLYHVIANIRRMTRNAKSEFTKPTHTKKAVERVRSYIQNAREDYRRLQDTLHSALNLDGGNRDSFSLDLQQSGPHTKLDIQSPLAQVGVETSGDGETATEVPFTEYLQDLVEATYAPDLASETDDSSNEYTSRKGDLAEDDIEEIDPEDEYDRLMEDQTINYLKLRAQHSYKEGSFQRRHGQTYDNPYNADHVVNLLSRSPDGRLRQQQSNVNQYVYESDEDTYNEYLSDLEKQFGPINEPAKIKIKNAFRQLKKSLDMINLDESESDIDGEDCKIPIFVTEEGARSQVSQYEESQPQRVVLAFTLTGVPVKLRLSVDIENPLKYLHKALHDAGISMYVPVLSSEVLQPVGSEVVLLGTCNKGPVVNAELVPSVSYVDDVKEIADRIEGLKSTPPIY